MPQMSSRPVAELMKALEAAVLPFAMTVDTLRAQTREQLAAMLPKLMPDAHFDDFDRAKVQAELLTPQSQGW